MTRHLSLVTCHFSVLGRFSLGLLLFLFGLLGNLSAAPRVQAARQPQIDPPAGWFTESVEIRIRSDLPDGVLRYTLDGSTPTASGASRYSQPLRVKQSTVIRVAAFVGDAIASDVATRTFLFADDVLHQKGAGFPGEWGTNNGLPVIADYEMDPEIVNHPAYRDHIGAALRSLPVVSLVLPLKDLFDPANGIYANPRESGEAWERPASFEIFPTSDRAGLQLNCGIRVQGGWNRRPEESPKHSFRVVFRKRYGAGKLESPLFGASAPREFDTLILRAGCNNTWLHWNGEERRRGDFLRDQWMRDTHAALGHPAAAGLFVHLYLNGLYWGLYNLTERPDERFAAARLGGHSSDYDARNGENILSGDEVAWNQLFRLANAGVSSDRSLAEIAELLDLPAFIDFMLIQLYGGNGDWDRHSNWYAARSRRPAGKFQFFVWDAERTLEFAEANTLAFDDDLSPPRLFHQLRKNVIFRRQFAARAKEVLRGDGILGARQAAQRFGLLAQKIDLAVIAESARWGDYRRDVHRYKAGPYELYTRDDHWRPEIDRIEKRFFPDRAEFLRKQFREADLE